MLFKENAQCNVVLSLICRVIRPYEQVQGHGLGLNPRGSRHNGTWVKIC